MSKSRTIIVWWRDAPRSSELIKKDWLSQTRHGWWNSIKPCFWEREEGQRSLLRSCVLCVLLLYLRFNCHLFVSWQLWALRWQHDESLTRGCLLMITHWRRTCARVLWNTGKQMLEQIVNASTLPWRFSSSGLVRILWGLRGFHFRISWLITSILLCFLFIWNSHISL